MPISINRTTQTLGYSAWFGLITGFADAILIFVYVRLTDRTLPLNGHEVWMAPLGNLVFFLALGALLALVFRLFPRLWSPTALAYGFGALGFYHAWHNMTPPLARWAGVFLALGCTVQLGRWVARNPDRFVRVWRWSVPAMAVLALAAGFTVSLRQRLLEQRHLAGLPAPSSKARNVLLLVLDTVRASQLSAFGYLRETTPNLERLAQRGTRFERAVSTARWTLPSHASIFTGRWHYELRADWTRRFSLVHTTLADKLDSLGYTTGGFVANTVFCDRSHGLDRGFLHYEDHPLTPGQVIRSTRLAKAFWNLPAIRDFVGRTQGWSRKSAGTVNRDFLRWVDRQEGRPFFAFLNYYDAHFPYEAPASHDTLFTEPVPPAARPPFKPIRPEAAARRKVELYDRAIRYIDDEIGRLLAELDRRGLLDETLIIVTADHGEEFAEHGVFDHGNSLYWPGIHVPLIMALPGAVPEGATVSHPVSLRDLPATVMDLLDVNDHPFPGQSLERAWVASAPPDADTLLAEVDFPRSVASWMPVARGDMKSAVIGAHHYIMNADGRMEIYDVFDDPFEQVDLAGDSALAEEKHSMGAYLPRFPAPGQGPNHIFPASSQPGTVTVSE